MLVFLNKVSAKDKQVYISCLHMIHFHESIHVAVPLAKIVSIMRVICNVFVI